jgi:hypothetical protein
MDMQGLQKLLRLSNKDYQQVRAALLMNMPNLDKKQEANPVGEDITLSSFECSALMAASATLLNLMVRVEKGDDAP